MLRYEQLPKGTSQATIIGILLCGICLGYALAITGIIALYGLSALLINPLFPASQLTFNPEELTFLAMLGVAAGVTTTIVGFEAYYMNALSKKAYPASRVASIALLLVFGLVWWQADNPALLNHLSQRWVTMSLLAIWAGGVIPAIFLQGKGARKVHSR